MRDNRTIFELGSRKKRNEIIFLPFPITARDAESQKVRLLNLINVDHGGGE